MKTPKTRGALSLIFVSTFLSVTTSQVHAQGARFFRISSPATAVITAFRTDGSLVWSNAQPGATYTIQTLSSSLSETNWADYVQITTTNEQNTNLIIDFNPPAGMTLIPAGIFMMGNSVDVETDAVPVSVEVSAFYADVNLVSFSRWQTVYNWGKTNGYSFLSTGSGKAANHPVQTVYWFDMVKWCNARSQEEGLNPVYYTDTNLTQLYTNGNVVDVYANWAANGYRLPTEAEWEKAARGGASGKRFPWGNTISEGLANYNGYMLDYTYDLGPNGYNATFATGKQPYTSPVGYFAPNGYGLYDMAGNIEECCWDWYDTPYAGGTDPHGPASSPYGARVVRGGSWSAYAPYVGCAFRLYQNPSAGSMFEGFRCVRGHSLLF